MRKITSFLIILLLLLSATAVFAVNDDDDCDPMTLAREIDAAYNTFLIDRSSMEEDVFMQSAEDFNAQLDAILANCGSIAATDDPHFINTAAGVGTLEMPYGFGQAGEASNGMTIRATSIIRPADDIIGEDEPVNHEWAIVEVEASCPFTSNGDCQISYQNFRLMGEGGELYDSVFALQYADQLDANIPTGRSREGGIAFIVPNEEANLRLVYYPEPYTIWPEQEGITYYRAQPSIEVTATARLIVRGGPGTMFAPLEALMPDTRAAAIGRNNDTSWVRIDNGWVSSQYVNTSIEELNQLPVLDPEG